jgi:hypothetical protein
MKSSFSNWGSSLIIIKPGTVIRWHLKGFKLYWIWKSKNNGGIPKIPLEQINLIKQIANDNPLWGIPHIHGLILKLGYGFSESTILRYIPKENGNTTGQRCITFLKNHTSDIISIDYFLYQQLILRSFTFWFSFLTKKGRLFTSMSHQIQHHNGLSNN